MGINLFDIGFRLIAYDLLSPVLKGAIRHVDELNAAAQRGAALREYSQNLAMVGVGALSAGAALAGGVAYVLKSAIAMQAEMARVHEAISDGADTMKHVAEAQATAEQLSAKGVIGAVALGESYYAARSNAMGHADALNAMNAANNLSIATTRNAADAQEQLITTTRTLTTLQKLSGVSTDTLADQLAALQTRYAELDIGEVTGGLKYAMPVSRGAGIGVKEMEAALALLSMGGMHGEEAGTAYREMIAKLTTKDTLQRFVRKTKEGGLELADTMQALASSMATLSPLQRTMELKSLGFNLRNVQGVNILIDRVNDLRSVEADLDNSRGEAARLAKIREAAADEQFANLQTNLDLLRATIGETLLPAVNRLIPRLAAGLQSLKGWAEAHEGLVKVGAEIAAWGAAILIPLGALALLGASLTFIASYGLVVFKLLNPFRLWALAVKAVTAGQRLLNAAMDANPIGLVIAGIALLAAAAYEVYEHWGAIKTFFVGIGAEFEKLGSEAYDWGVNLLKKFGDGIASAAMWPVHAIENVAHRMSRFVVGHSPIPEGPLHDLNLSRDLARTIQPAPLMLAMRQAAAAMVLASPLVVGAIPAAASPVMPSIPIATQGIIGGIPAPSAARTGQARAMAAGDSIVVNYSPRVVVNALGGDEATIRRVVMDALDRDRDKLLDIIERARAKRARREFD